VKLQDAERLQHLEVVGPSAMRGTEKHEDVLVPALFEKPDDACTIDRGGALIATRLGDQAPSEARLLVVHAALVMGREWVKGNLRTSSSTRTQNV
jgi:hypothetical protein